MAWSAAMLWAIEANAGQLAIALIIGVASGAAGVASMVGRGLGHGRSLGQDPLQQLGCIDPFALCANDPAHRSMLYAAEAARIQRSTPIQCSTRILCMVNNHRSTHIRHGSAIRHTANGSPS